MYVSVEFIREMKIAYIKILHFDCECAEEKNKTAMFRKSMYCDTVEGKETFTH